MGLISNIFNWRPSSSTPAKARERWPLDMELFYINKKRAFTLRDACANVNIMGAPGSGKTTGALDMIALSYLSAGMGGLILTVKQDETALWIERARLTGRLDDVILVGPQHGHVFDFVAYEMGYNAEAVNTTNLVLDVIALAERASGQLSGGGGDNDGYFKRASKSTITTPIQVLSEAGEDVSIANIVEFINTQPNSLEEVASERWQRSSYCFRSLSKADELAKDPSRRRDLKEAARFVLRDWPALSDRTRSSIHSTIVFTLDILTRGTLRDLLSGESTVTPDVIGDGSIIILDMPMRAYGDIAQLYQLIWKLMVMKWAERRNVSENPRPAFMAIDEAQNALIPKYDAQFLATCRSQRFGVVMASQNLPSYYLNLSGEKGKHEADSILANCATHFYHLNNCSVTNTWASERCFRSKQYLFSGSSGPGDDADAFGMLTGTGKSGGSASFSEHYELDLQPAEFTRLRNGGPANAWRVDAIMMQAASTGQERIWMPVTFEQRH